MADAAYRSHNFTSGYEQAMSAIATSSQVVGGRLRRKSCALCLLLVVVFLDECFNKLEYFCLFFDMGRVSTFGEDYFAVLAAVGLVVVHDGAHLRDHRLRGIDFYSGPTGDGAQLSEEAEVEQGGVRDDLVVRAAYP